MELNVMQQIIEAAVYGELQARKVEINQEHVDHLIGVCIRMACDWSLARGESPTQFLDLVAAIYGTRNAEILKEALGNQDKPFLILNTVGIA